MAPSLTEIAAALGELGFAARGGFHPQPEDGVPALPGGRLAGTLVLAGNVGGAMWRAFEAARAGRRRPSLDAWTREQLAPLAERLGAQALFPFGGPPYLPFQRWARRAEPVHPSPIGLLIHPEYGLWHAYRGALAFEAEIRLPAVPALPSPCESCATRPCLSACPVDALAPGSYDVPACRRHLGREAGRSCLHEGCLARRACPVGRGFAYGPDQMRFHMEAFRSGLRPALRSPRRRPGPG